MKVGDFLHYSCHNCSCDISGKPSSKILCHNEFVSSSIESCQTFCALVSFGHPLILSSSLPQRPSHPFQDPRLALHSHVFIFLTKTFPPHFSRLGLNLVPLANPQWPSDPPTVQICTFNQISNLNPVGPRSPCLILRQAGSKLEFKRLEIPKKVEAGAKGPQKF